MAFVARNDQHGNEIMRVMLSTEPGKLTVASCQNLRINCGPETPLNEGEGRYDHRQRFHYYAEDIQAPRRAEHKSKSVAEPIAQQERVKERERTHKLLREKQSLSDDESAAWNSAEINAHSTLVSTGKPTETSASRHANTKPFNSWLAEKNKSQQQQAEDRRLVAQQEDQRAVERARLAHQKYRNWLDAKSSQLRRAKSDLSSMQNSSTSRQSLPADEAQRRLVDWEREKLTAMKAQREKRKAKQEKQQLIDSTRRELSAEAWEQWVDASKTKPRPVPMGQGLDSLRGSMAPLYTNPNEWQPLLPTARRNPQPQSGQTTAPRSGPDYERLERLAQPRRNHWRPSLRLDERKCEEAAEKLNESLKTQEEEANILGEKSGSLGVARQSSAPEGSRDFERCRKEPEVMPEAQPCNDGSWISIAIEKVETVQPPEQQEDASVPLQPRGKPIIWSKNNAQRVRELREVINPLDAQMPRQLRDDQVEQLRKHQDLQNSKVLPRKYQQKREQLREKLKAWVEEGKLLPERLLSDGSRPNHEDHKPTEQEPKDNSQRETNTNESKGQRSEDQMQSTTRKSFNPEQRARSTDPARLLKLKEPKGPRPKSRPWR